jgi:hypothetical protein
MVGCLTACLVLAMAASCLVPQTAAAAGSGTHIPASQYAAQNAPEPFHSNWQACIGAMVPDLMRDQPLGHENHRSSGLLYSAEAIRYLKRGETAKALLTASIRVHYLTDSLAIAHGDVWYPRHESDVMQPGVRGARIWSFLPQSVQGYWLPFDAREPGINYDRLRIDDPPLQALFWHKLADRRLSRSMHAFFDSTEIHRGHPKGQFPLEHVPDTTNWSAYDYEIYGRWRSEQIALEVLDRDSVLGKSGWVRFADAPQFQRAMDHEMENMIAAVSAYYRYLTVARDTELLGDLDMLLPGHDRLLLMARHDPAIYLSEDAPWPLRRACSLLAMEMVRARFRAAGDLGASFAEDLSADIDAIIRTVKMPAGEDARRVLVSWNESPEQRQEVAAREMEGNAVAVGDAPGAQGHIVLRGENLQSAIHLVDYLLDLAHAPFLGRAPMEVMLTAFEKEWDGLDLMDTIRVTPDAELPALVKGIVNPHKDDPEAWAAVVHGLVRPHSDGSDVNLTGVLPRFYDYMVLSLPLPDGERIDLSDGDG